MADVNVSDHEVAYLVHIRLGIGGIGKEARRSVAFALRIFTYLLLLLFASPLTTI